MPGLFGPTADEIASADAQAQNARALQYGALGPENAGGYLGFRAGQQLGGLLSGQSPLAARQAVVEDALRQTQSSVPFGSKDFYTQLQSNLAGRGLMNEAAAIQQFETTQREETAKARKSEAEAGLLEEQNKALGGVNYQSRDPQYWEKLGVAFKRSEFTTHAQKLRQEQADASQLEQWADPSTGKFTDLFDDPEPNVAAAAKRAQAALTAMAASPGLTPEGAKRLVDEATRAYASLSAKSTAIATAKAGKAVTPEDLEANAQMIASYHRKPPSGSALRNSQGYALMARVREINPDYDERHYVTSQAMENEVTRGVTGRTIRSLNVMTDHLAVAQDLIDTLQNGDVRLINAAKQRFAKETGQTAPTNFSAVKEFVSREVDKAIRGAGVGTGEERKSLSDQLAISSSPQQLRGVIDQWQKLAAGQFRGLEQQFKSGHGVGDFGTRFLTPRALQVFQSLPASGAAPETWTSDKERRYQELLKKRGGS